MKKFLLVCFMAMLLVNGNFFSLKAQDNPVEQKQPDKKKKSKFGSFLGKLGEATTGINMTDEPFVVVPTLLKAISAQLVGCYGESNTGLIELIFTVKNNNNLNFINMSPDKAYDKSGNAFEGGYDSKAIDLPRGIPIKATLEYKNVNVALTQLELIKVRANVNGGSEFIEFHNIPIQWDVQPASAQVESATPAATKVFCPLKLGVSVNFVSCVGDPGSRSVSLAFTVKNSNNTDHLIFYSDKAYDSSGNTCKGTSGSEAADLPRDIPVKLALEYGDVDANLKYLDLVNVKVNHSGGSCSIEFRNVPIEWAAAK